MRKKLRAAHAAAWLLGGATLAVSGAAHADNCPVPDSSTVYMAGSSAFVPVLQPLVNALGGAVKIRYQKPGSCEGLDPIVEGTPKVTGSVTILTSGAAALSCTETVNPSVDIGMSDVYPDTCRATFDPNLPQLGTSFKDFLGPIQAMTIAVPAMSTENTISAEAAYMIFGFDAAQGDTISPWVTPADIYVRNWDSGTLEMIGKAIGLPGGKWNATAAAGTVANQAGSGGAMAGILAAPAAGHVSSTIGILSTSGLTAAIRPLAFQGTGQTCSYLPDSSSVSSATDKINVRQGRYEIWGPEHLVTAVDGSGNPVGQNSNTIAVQTVINALLSSSQALPSESDGGASDGGVTTLTEAQVGSLIAAFSVPTVGFIPWCAMQVSRTTEVGPESSYAPPAACSCAYEQVTSTVPGHTCTACTAANASTVCTGATPKCHFGYCEAE